MTAYSDPSISIVFNNGSFRSCGNMAVNQTCYWTLNVTVPAGTPPIIIKLYVNGTWTNPELTTNMTQNVTNIYIASNPVLEIKENILENVTPHQRTTYVGNVTVSLLEARLRLAVQSAWFHLSHQAGAIFQQATTSRSASP
jgi:hypothetical protein